MAVYVCRFLRVLSESNSFRDLVIFSRKQNLCYFNRTAKAKKQKEIEECCKILDLSEVPDERGLKEAFLKLAKKYHPDSGLPTANTEKFASIESSYRTLYQLLTSVGECDNIEEKDFSIKHVVPQHRRYLTYDGVGYGTPSQRQKQYICSKVDKAWQNVYEYQGKKMNPQNEKHLITKDASLARQYKTGHAVERLVEDLIQESMSKGEFDNLAGAGKPLKFVPENPYLDRVTHKLNQILICNGFSPEWISLDKEIKEKQLIIRQKLEKESLKVGSPPLSTSEEINWKKVIQSLQSEAKALNQKIDKFNMLVPALSMQKLHFVLDKEAIKILEQK